MVSGDVNPRPYRSKRRREQAEQTRQRVLDTAEMLFVERGWQGTSVVAIAQQAGVSPETVYARFGTKRAVLGELVRRAARGSDPRPVTEQAAPRALVAASSQQDQLRVFAEDIALRLERAAPLVAVVAAAAHSEPELAELLTRIHADRRRNLRLFVEALDRNATLRVSRERAVDTVWALTSPELHQLFMRVAGWTRRRYCDWLVDGLAQVLLTGRASR